MRLNQTKFASLVGCSQQNISKLINKGVIQKEDDNKIDIDKAKKSLLDHGLLGEDGKLLKSRTANNETKTNSRKFYPTTAALPLEGEVPYDSYAYLTPEEIKAAEEEKEKLRKEYQEKEHAAKSKNITTEPVDNKTYSDAKTFRENYMGKIAEFDYLIKTGEYILKTEVEKKFFEAARTIRDSLLNYPNKMALRIVGKSDIKEIEDILMNEIQIILENLSNES